MADDDIPHAEFGKHRAGDLTSLRWFFTFSNILSTQNHLAAQWCFIEELGYLFNKYEWRQITARIPLDKPPEVLEDRAREVLKTLAAPAPVDDAAAYSLDLDYVQWVEARDSRPNRWDTFRSGRPPIIRYWYRQSPQLMLSTKADCRVSPTNPPLMVSGMAGVDLDLQGRLSSFYVVPPQLDDPKEAAANVDYDPLFSAAGLDPAQFSETGPRWTPPFHTDARRAWTGHDPARPDLPLRVEAAAYQGRPVWFQILGEWSRPERMQAFQWSAGRKMSNRLGSAVLLAVVVVALLLARNNLRLGRGDRRGAQRLAGYAFSADLVVWLLSAHHLASLVDEAILLIRAVAFALFLAGAVWVLYLAIEPYVRRGWPDTLVSWTRLLSGRWSDPVVGRDVLIGVAAGALIAWDLPLARRLVPQWLGLPEPALHASNLDTLLGLRMAAANVVGHQVGAVAGALILVLMLVAFRLALRREWLAATALAVLMSLQNSLSSGLPLRYVLPVNIVTIGVPLYVCTRLGMLPLTVAIFVTDMMIGLPVPASLPHWASGAILLGIGVSAALAVYGFRTAAVRAPAAWAPASGSASRAA